MSSEQKYYILSMKWTKEFAVFWGPNNGGYFQDLARAGVYTQSQIDENPSYYNNHESTLAVPIEDVDLLMPRKVVPQDSELYTYITGKVGFHGHFYYGEGWRKYKPKRSKSKKTVKP